MPLVLRGSFKMPASAVFPQNCAVNRAQLGLIGLLLCTVARELMGCSLSIGQVERSVLGTINKNFSSM